MEARHLLAVTIGRRILELLPEIDLIITKSGMPIKITGIPRGVKIVGMEYNIARDGLTMLLEHPDFPEIQEGAMVESAMYIDHAHNWNEIEVDWK